ncbi:MAG: hypothetical protein M1825_001112 [Sarcosagium campestre]|nr:MAG: hypothetical protein M1825_001112 [Sarcosagium campestre]
MADAPREPEKGTRYVLGGACLIDNRLRPEPVSTPVYQAMDWRSEFEREAEEFARCSEKEHRKDRSPEPWWQIIVDKREAEKREACLQRRLFLPHVTSLLAKLEAREGRGEEPEPATGETSGPTCSGTKGKKSRKRRKREKKAKASATASTVDDTEEPPRGVVTPVTPVVSEPEISSCSSPLPGTLPEPDASSSRSRRAESIKFIKERTASRSSKSSCGSSGQRSVVEATPGLSVDIPFRSVPVSLSGGVFGSPNSDSEVDDSPLDQFPNYEDSHFVDETTSLNAIDGPSHDRRAASSAVPAPSDPADTEGSRYSHATEAARKDSSGMNPQANVFVPSSRVALGQPGNATDTVVTASSHHLIQFPRQIPVSALFETQAVTSGAKKARDSLHSARKSIVIVANLLASAHQTLASARPPANGVQQSLGMLPSQVAAQELLTSIDKSIRNAKDAMDKEPWVPEIHQAADDVGPLAQGAESSVVNQTWKRRPGRRQTAASSSRSKRFICELPLDRSISAAEMSRFIDPRPEEYEDYDEVRGPAQSSSLPVTPLKNVRSSLALDGNCPAEKRPMSSDQADVSKSSALWPTVFHGQNRVPREREAVKTPSTYVFGRMPAKFDRYEKRSPWSPSTMQTNPFDGPADAKSQDARFNLGTLTDAWQTQTSNLPAQIDELRCAYCSVSTPDGSPTTLLCRACGPQSITRYCCRRHLLLDIHIHWQLCGLMSVKSIPTDSRLLASRFYHDYPAIINRHGWTSLEFHRQRAWTIDYHNNCDYALFADWRQSKKSGLTVHGLPLPSHELYWDRNSPIKDIVNRLLNVAFYDHYLTPVLALLFGLIREAIRCQPDYTLDLENELQHQFREEFRFDASNLGQDNPDVFVHWERPTGLVTLVERVEASVPVVRMWRREHPDKVARRDAWSRYMGVGFPEPNSSDHRGFGAGWAGLTEQ